MNLVSLWRMQTIKVVAASTKLDHFIFIGNEDILGILQLDKPKIWWMPTVHACQIVHVLEFFTVYLVSSLAPGARDSYWFEFNSKFLLLVLYWNRLAKDVIKGMKKRIGHKNPKIQLLALTVSLHKILSHFYTYSSHTVALSSCSCYSFCIYGCTPLHASSIFS